MIPDDGNETDVREEIAMPLLAALGYKRGTANDIAREVPLAYERQFLGRKKNTDKSLRGRADYILTVVGSGRWVLEIKAPQEPIDIDAIEQAMAYARHPEVSAHYAVVVNGKRLTVHHASQRSRDKPLLDLSISDPISMANLLEGILSPGAIRRDCSPPPVDLGLPLATALRSSATIHGGCICYDTSRWSSNVELPSSAAANYDELCGLFNGLQVTITGGTISRDEQSRIRAKPTWALPNKSMYQHALDKQLLDMEYLALGQRISENPEAPTLFEIVGAIKIEAGEQIYDLRRWRVETAGVDVLMEYQGQVAGYLADHIFKGTVSSMYLCTYPNFPQLQVQVSLEGMLSIELSVD